MGCLLCKQKTAYEVLISDWSSYVCSSDLRQFPASVLSPARVGREGLERLEDRLADMLVHPLMEGGHSVFVAKKARAVIDLNRSDNEIDPGMIANAPPHPGFFASAKVRGGLGLIPRRLSTYGDLWNGPFEWPDVKQRIMEYHQPYHLALGDSLRMARQRFGCAILLDIHSMPPLTGQGGLPSAKIVLGDRFGRSASGRLTDAAAHIFAARGLKVAQNHPYPGNYLLERHGRPSFNVHAIQCEIDRSLYLDGAFRWPSAGLARLQGVLLDVAASLAGELPEGDFAQAAE